MDYIHPGIQYKKSCHQEQRISSVTPPDRKAAIAKRPVILMTAMKWRRRSLVWKPIRRTSSNFYYYTLLLTESIMMNPFQKRSMSLLRSKSLQPTISIFCGASPGNSPVYVKTARALALTLHKHNISHKFFSIPRSDEKGVGSKAVPELEMRPT